MEPRTTYRVIYIVHKVKVGDAGRHRKRGMQRRKVKVGDRRKMIRQVPEG